MYKNIVLLGLFFLPYAESAMIQNEQHYLDLGYCDLWYQTWYTQATKNKVPLIVIHGGPGFSHHNLINLKDVADQRPVILYDQSGCGKSKIKKEVNWTFEYYVHELEQFINKLGFKKVMLLGYSWGSALAVRYAVMHPDKVEKLVLVSPYVNTRDYLDNYKQRAQSKNLYDVMLKHEQQGTQDSSEYQEAVTTFFKTFIYRGKPQDLEFVEPNKEIVKVMWGPNELSVTGNLKNLDLIPELKKLTMPVLLTYGTYDMVTTEFVEKLKNQIKNSTVVMFNNSSHMPQIEEKELYIKTIKAFTQDEQTSRS